MTSSVISTKVFFEHYFYLGVNAEAGAPDTMPYHSGGLVTGLSRSDVHRLYFSIFELIDDDPTSREFVTGSGLTRAYSVRNNSSSSRLKLQGLIIFLAQCILATNLRSIALKSLLHRWMRPA
jgi:hypothetical protein